MLKSHEEHRNSQFEEKISNRKYEQGIIRTISPQGDKVYVIIERVTAKKSVEYFGGYRDIPNDDLLISELLIELDITTVNSPLELDSLIGKSVIVESTFKGPEIARLISPKESPRKISRQDIQMARAASEDRSIKSDIAKAVLRGIGYLEDEINATLEESLSNIDILGGRLVYKDSATWDAVTDRDIKGIQMDESYDSGIVRGLNGGTLSKRYCFEPALVLTGR